MNLKYILLSCIFFLCATTVFCNQERVVVAYYTARDTILPDPNYVTHINFAFGTIRPKTFDAVEIKKLEYIHLLNNLKKTNPDIKIILSIGGWGAGGFSEMASNSDIRLKFVKDCAKKCEELNLDGIDLDWEYPSVSVAGIKSSPNDIDNFTLLIKDLRAALGKERILTLASSPYAHYVRWADVVDYVDFVNIMAYNMGLPPYHNAPLFPSKLSQYSVKQAINSHVRVGVPVNKLVLGIPFYGRGNKKMNISGSVHYKNLSQYTSKYIQLWDSIAMVPYLVNDKNEMVVSFDNEESVRLKCNYAIAQGLLGIMFWESYTDDKNHTLTKAAYNAIIKN